METREGGGGGEVLPFLSYVNKCRPKGSRFKAVGGVKLGHRFCQFGPELGRVLKETAEHTNVFVLQHFIFKRDK